MTDGRNNQQNTKTVADSAPPKERSGRPRRRRRIRPISNRILHHEIDEKIAALLCS